MKRIALFSFACFIAVPVFAQSPAVIQCGSQSGIKTVPVYGTAQARWTVDMVSCDQPISLLTMEQGYAKIRFGERTGYVDAKFVRLLQTQPEIERRVAALEAQTRAAQQAPAPAPTAPAPLAPKPVATDDPQSASHSTRPASEAARAVPAPTERSAFSYPKAELFGGYNYVHLGYGAGWMDGWNASVSGNFHPAFGIKAELSGLYAKNTLYNSVRYSGYSFLAGPQFSARGRSFTGFGHVLLGLSHLSGSAPFGGIRIGASLNAFSMAFGGGVDWHGSRKIALRIAQVDYFPWRALGGTAQNIRVSTGVIARF